MTRLILHGHPVCRKSIDSMDILDIFHGINGHCPWNLWNVWTMSMEPMECVDNVQGTVDIVHGIFPASPHERVDKFHGHCTLSSMDNFHS